MALLIELLPGGIVPKRGTDGSAGYDLFLPHSIELSNGLNLIPLRIKIKLPPNTYGSIRCRSSLAMKGMSVEAGVIDEDYVGEIKVLLRTREIQMELMKGHAIAQLIVQPYLTPQVQEVTYLEKTDRGSSGFGSTDKNVASI
tara:strand:- start:995 stop:1420 length:426 start_codon:yes stop_codon:yes gene_type:complete